ncbi:MAG: hypothetical protein JJE52_14470 [Acidimicrobiia bacterium]|nr:hypothetical protein [Acidimicrobiia bacterium]
MVNAHVTTLLNLAAGHDGVVNAAALARRGVGRRQVDGLVSSGVIERVGVGLLRVSAAPPTWQQRQRIAVWAAPPPAGASHRAAALVWGVEDIGAIPVEVTAPRRSRWHARSVLVHHGALPPCDITARNGITVTTPERTIVDLAGVLDLGIVERALDQFLRRRLVAESDIDDLLGRDDHRARVGSGELRALLDRRREVDGVADTSFETRLLQIIRAHGLPEPVRQHVLLDADGSFVARFDAAYPAHRVGIEADSERWHMNRDRFIADRSRRNQAETLGWRVPSFTWHHLTKEPQSVGVTIERTLHVAGWPGG